MEENKLRIAIGFDSILLEDIIDVSILENDEYNFNYLVRGVHPHQLYNIGLQTFVAPLNESDRNRKINNEEFLKDGFTYEIFNENRDNRNKLVRAECFESYLRLISLLKENSNLYILTPSLSFSVPLSAEDIEKHKQSYISHVRCEDCKASSFVISSYNHNVSLFPSP